MPSYRGTKRGTKKWIARRKRDDIEFFLGYYATQEEATQQEQLFDLDFPRGFKAF